MPATVGKRLRDGCSLPSGYSMRGPATPARGRCTRKSRSVATAPSCGTASGFTLHTSSAVETAAPALTLAPKPRGRGFSISRTAAGSDPALPGTFATTISSST